MSAYVFFDLDGTLWDRSFVIPEDTAISIRELQERGGKAFLCTGRSRANTHQEQLSHLGLDGMVCACGCHIEVGGSILYERLLSDSVVNLLLDVTSRYTIPIVYEGPEYEWFDPALKEGDWNMAARWDHLGDRAKLLSSMKAPYRVNKVTVAAEYPGQDEALKDALKDKVTFIAHPYGYEIVPLGASKLDGIHRVQHLFSVEDSDVYAFGDGGNDIEMVSGAAHGIAMGNGIRALKNTAEFITTDIHKGGIRNALKHYQLIP